MGSIMEEGRAEQAKDNVGLVIVKSESCFGLSYVIVPTRQLVVALMMVL